MQPSKYRARIAALHHLRDKMNTEAKTASTPRKKELDLDIAQVRNGVFPKGYNESELVALMEKQNSYPNKPLTTTELMSFNTYFAIHPEKVCGQEIVSSSRDFPVSISGTKEEVILAIDNTLQRKDNMELEAQALEVELNLFKL